MLLPPAYPDYATGIEKAPRSPAGLIKIKIPSRQRAIGSRIVNSAPPADWFDALIVP